MLKLLLVAAAAALTACRITPAAFEPLPAQVDYGAQPADAEPAVRGRMETILRDAESARYRFGTPYRAYAHDLLHNGGKLRFVGYRVDFQVNATNGFGGYTGFQDYMALFERGELVHVFKTDSVPWTFTTSR